MKAKQEANQSDHGLLGELDFHELLASGHHVLILDAHDATAPLSEQLLVVVELALEEVAQLLEVDEVLPAHLRQGDASRRLQVHKSAKVGLAPDKAEGNTLLSAESGQVDNKLDRVDVVRDDDQLGLVLLHERRHVVQTELEVHGLLGLFVGTLVGFLLLSLCLQSVALGGLGLGLVLVEQFKEFGSYD